MENKSYSLKDILDKLVGDICVNGETNSDNESFDNICEVEEFLVSTINKLASNSKFKDRKEYSMKKVANKSDEVINRIKDVINYYEEE